MEHFINFWINGKLSDQKVIETQTLLKTTVGSNFKAFGNIIEAVIT